MQLLRNFETSLISFSLSFQKQQDSFTKSYFFRPDTQKKTIKICRKRNRIFFEAIFDTW